jgi:hypothetical protein
MNDIFASASGSKLMWTQKQDILEIGMNTCDALII